MPGGESIHLFVSDLASCHHNFEYEFIDALLDIRMTGIKFTTTRISQDLQWYSNSAKQLDGHRNTRHGYWLSAISSR